MSLILKDAYIAEDFSFLVPPFMCMPWKVSLPEINKYLPILLFPHPHPFILPTCLKHYRQWSPVGHVTHLTDETSVT